MTWSTVSVEAPQGTMGAVRFQVQGLVDGVPRIVLDHVTRLATPTRCPSGRSRRQGGGCYRVELKGEPNITLDLVHEGEHGDHNVSGMITTAVRLVTAVAAVCDVPGGFVYAKDLTQVTGRGLVAVREPPSDRDWTEPGAHPIAHGVHRIPLPLPMDGLRAVNVYVLETDEGLVLVDAGWAIPESRPCSTRR